MNTPNHALTPIDLHTHSTASDGLLSPAALVERAAARGVALLALTDHDTTAGLGAARRAARRHDVALVAGVEISVTWEKHLLHVLGLDIDPDCAALQDGLAGLQHTREARAETMGERLARCGIPGASAGARALAGEGMITRTHFARFLVSGGHAPDVAAVFKRYLRPGKPGHVATRWADLEEAIGWIRAAGGVAVLAHPLRYRMTASWLRRALQAFRAAGGTGMEVACGTHGPNDTAACAGHARRHGLLGSVGSDFHEPGRYGIELGRPGALPDGVAPVWAAW